VLQDTPEEPAGHHHGLKSGRTDTHAPAGLMGDHAHGKGEMMVEYKYMNMYMGGSRAGHTAISTGAARMFDGNMFMVVPEAMTMEMHMTHFMWAPSDEVTLYVMPMWMVNTMDHLRRDGTNFTTINQMLGSSVGTATSFRARMTVG
jgi:hypothetical protein